MYFSFLDGSLIYIPPQSVSQSPDSSENEMSTEEALQLKPPKKDSSSRGSASASMFTNICIIVYYVMRSKNEVLCAAAGRLAAERNEAHKPAKAHKTIFAPNNIYYFFFKPS
jgi:hypothetical protein